jgi:hypothetical protein
MKIENYTDLVSLCTTPDDINTLMEQTFDDKELRTASKDEFEKLYKYAAGRLKELGWTKEDAIAYVFKLDEL